MVTLITYPLWCADSELIRSVGTKNFMRFHDRFYGEMFLSGTSEADSTNQFGILSAKCATTQGMSYGSGIRV